MSTMISKKELEELLKIFRKPRTKEQAKRNLINAGIIDSKGKLNKYYYRQ